MGPWKEILTRSLIIMLAALLVVAGFQMLAADQIAGGADPAAAGVALVEEGASGGDEQLANDMPAFLGTVISFVKEILFMGIPFAVTLGVLALIGKISGRRKTRAAPSGAAS